MPIGGLKEKLLAAHRGGVKHVIIPAENEKDLREIPENVKENLSIHAVKWMDEVLELALTTMPEPRLKDDVASTGTETNDQSAGEAGRDKAANVSADLISPH